MIHSNNLYLILASKSPRRQDLIKGLELSFTIQAYEVDESFPTHLQAHEIALYLAQKKADAYPHTLKENEVLLTADTIVWIDNTVLNKPKNEADSFRMLKTICGATHQVYTGVCLKSANNTVTFYDKTDVTCRALSDDAIWHYINNYKPFDKAGSYGIQDWFGYTAVEKINGCFYNVMGLPVGKVYQQLQSFW
jgi:septum formation protein